MSTHAHQLVTASFAQVAPHADEAGRVFYRQLFVLDPGLRALFKGDIEAQGRKLLQMIGTAVSLLDQPMRLLPALESLGQRHAGYGVKERHYDTVGLALIQTLELLLGAAFTDEVRSAWHSVYQELAGAMIKASAPATA